MARLDWYWHRMRAMSPVELALHGRRKVRQLSDARRKWDAHPLPPAGAGLFPRLPAREAAPGVLLEALAHDLEAILAGRWSAFRQVDLLVDDPPKWHCDYLVGRDLSTDALAFGLDHRSLPGGADIKLIWELSRWNQLVRLAMGSYLLRDVRAAQKCIEWLEDWVRWNPPYRGWNWTSALEVGLRLIQFAWMDALMTGCDERDQAEPAAGAGERWASLRAAILRPHVAYAWRHRSFGSSANNHLLGELAGCILVVARWPTLAGLAAPLAALQRSWERQVLAQFATDGGNKEQALNYHLFSFDLCWQTFRALEMAQCDIDPPVRERLVAAAQFFERVQAAAEPWGYGDSDDAFVTPLFAKDAALEWYEWLSKPESNGAVGYWLGEAPVRASHPAPAQPPNTTAVGHWWLYPDTGIAIRASGRWRLRWDVSPLGHLATAAHGHLDALHLSLWVDGHALIVDPGTGAYYGDLRLREWLASRAAHNAPCPAGEEQPRRLGPFLWAEHHHRPTLTADGRGAVATLDLPEIELRRRIVDLAGGSGWQVEDACIGPDRRPAAFTVRWQFAPGWQVQRLSERVFSLSLGSVTAAVEVSPDWELVQLISPAPDRHLTMAGGTAGHPMEGLVSPAFRVVCRAPCLMLTAPAVRRQDAVLRTTFFSPGHT
jgi:Heparinase II/III-like protein